MDVNPIFTLLLVLFWSSQSPSGNYQGVKLLNAALSPASYWEKTLDARVSTWKFEYTCGKIKLKFRWMMWLKCEHVKCKRDNVHVLVKRQINCENVHFNCTLYYWKFHLLSKFCVIFLQFHSVSTCGSSDLHVNTNHITTHAKMYISHFITFILSLLKMSGSHFTFTCEDKYSICVWKCDYDESRLMRSESKPKHWDESFQDF